MAPSSISRSRKAVLRARWSETEMPSVVAMAMRAGFMKAYGNMMRRDGPLDSAQRRDDPQRALGAPIGHPAAQGSGGDQHDQQQETGARDLLINHSGNAESQQDFGAVERRHRQQVEQPQLKAQLRAAIGLAGECRVGIERKGGDSAQNDSHDHVAERAGQGHQQQAVQTASEFVGLRVDRLAPSQEAAKKKRAHEREGGGGPSE